MLAVRELRPNMLKLVFHTSGAGLMQHHGEAIEIGVIVVHLKSWLTPPQCSCP